MTFWHSLPLKSRWMVAGVGLGLVGVIGVLIATTFAPQKKTLQVVTVGKGDIEKVVMVTGTLKPAVQVNVGAQVNGQLRKLYVREGDKVKKGQLLAEIDPTIQESDLNNARAQLASAKAQKLASQAMLIRYREELARQRAMQHDGSGIRSDFEQAKAQYDAQLQQINVNEAQIVQAEMAVKTANANLGYTRIVAPIDGEVLGIVTAQGQTIVSSQMAPTILVLADLDSMLVQTRISEADIQKIHPGQPLWFYVIANPDKHYSSKMGFVQPAPQEALEDQNLRGGSNNQRNTAVYYTGSFAVPNPRRELKTSMTAQVFIRIAEAKDVVRIPIAVLGHALDAGRYNITTFENGKSQSRTVHIGINDRQYAQVLDGLREGDKVVIAQNREQG